MRPLKTLFGLLCIGMLSACGSLFTADQQATTEIKEAKVNRNLGNIERDTNELANELFAGMGKHRGARYAIAGFVPVTSMVYNSKDQNPLMLLGQQLEQGLMTEANRRGFTTRDYKLTNGIVMGKYSDKALSRDLDLISSQVEADFYITGTITEQQGGAIVNARVINADNKDVVGAATRFFPNQLFWGAERVTTRGGMLYRSDSHF